MSNPNNCAACDHYRSQQINAIENPAEAALHCYMFKDAPSAVCLHHTARTSFVAWRAAPPQASAQEEVKG